MIDNLLIRDARIEDSMFVARCLLAAMEMVSLDAVVEGEDSVLLDSVVNSCVEEGLLYSYCNARVAEVKGELAGCLISYDGGGYEAMREATFGKLLKENGIDLTGNPMETGPGEYYLDSMAVVSKYRGLGIGHSLMSDGIARARSLGVSSVVLLVDEEHPRLQAYYEQLGFVPCDMMEAFGARYIKLALAL